MNYIDFRSDTVTQPTSEMRQVMFEAAVGDDVFGEDPTVNELQNYAANLFGKEAAIFCSSGTQTNQIAIQLHTSPGGEVICHEESHIYRFEGGGIAKNSHASVRLIAGNRGRITADAVRVNHNNPDDIHLPLTQLVSIEDTSNRGGGAIYDFETIQAISQTCKTLQVPFHLDGARMMNALVENQVDYKEYAAQFDTFSLCLSKGLGAPVGSLLIGDKTFIQRAKRIRKVMGGGMRQAGFLAAAGLYALKNNVTRLKEDHSRAKSLGEALTHCSWVYEVLPVETNIVIILLKEAELRDFYLQALKEKGILAVAFGIGAIRFVTHLNISDDDLQQTIERLKVI